MRWTDISRLISVVSAIEHRPSCMRQSNATKTRLARSPSRRRPYDATCALSVLADKDLSTVALSVLTDRDLSTVALSVLTDRDLSTVAIAMYFCIE